MKRRALLLGVVAWLVGSSLFPALAFAWDVEVDRPDFPNTTQAFPCYFPSVAPYDSIDCSFVITLPYGGHAVAKWQCDGYTLAATVHFRNYTVHGPKSYTVPVDGSGIPSLNVGPDASMPWGSAGHARTCALGVTAVPSDAQLANVYAAQPFSLTDVTMWATFGTDGDQEEPFPEPTPTPSPTPGPSPTPTVYEATCTPVYVSGTTINHGYALFSPNVTVQAGDVFRIDRKGVTWGDGHAHHLNVDIQTEVSSGTWNVNVNSNPYSPTSSNTTIVPYFDLSYAAGNEWGGTTYQTGTTTTVNQIGTAYGTAGVSHALRVDCHNQTNTAHATDVITTRYQFVFISGPSEGTYNPAPTPTPTPTPGASPTPTPVTGGTFDPGPQEQGFDVCGTPYTASEKMMCSDPPDWNDIGVDECEGEDDATLAGCQPIEPWDGPEGGGGGGDDGTPGGSGEGDSGVTECIPTPVEGKIGYAAPDEVPDVNTLAARVDGKDPLGGLGESIGWIGDMVWTLPNRIGNGIKWAWNAGVDAGVPGDCLGDVIEARWLALQEEPPFSIFYDVSDAVDGATTATAGSIPTMTLLGQTITFPLASIESGVAPYRGLFGAGVWLLGAMAALRIVVGSFGVGKGSEG